MNYILKIRSYWKSQVKKIFVKYNVKYVFTYVLTDFENQKLVWWLLMIWTQYDEYPTIKDYLRLTTT